MSDKERARIQLSRGQIDVINQMAATFETAQFELRDRAGLLTIVATVEGEEVAKHVVDDHGQDVNPMGDFRP